MPTQHLNLETVTGEWFYTGECHTITESGRCELCGNFEVIYLFTIQNKCNHTRLETGSECVRHWLNASDLEKIITDRRKLEKQRHIQTQMQKLERAAQNSEWLRQRKHSFSSWLKKHGRLTKSVQAIVERYNNAT
jgi:Zn-finger nucleic acid-binding protein